MEFKIREKSSGIIYSSSINEKEHCILSINFSDESTDFEVQDMIVNENKEILFRTRQLAIYNKTTLTNCIISAIREENEAEWIND